MKIKLIFTKMFAKVVNYSKKDFTTDNRYVEYSGQEANDFIYNKLATNKPCMIAKFGTVELGVLISYKVNEGAFYKIKSFIDAIKHKIVIDPSSSMKSLCSNAGFFPYDLRLGYLYYKRMCKDIQEIDILGSYMENESYFHSLLNCNRVDLDGYYAPFLWNNPWTRILKGKRVLVVHPFTDSIKKQYENRKRIFSNEDVLPEFEQLILVKAVQSIADAKNQSYGNWFEALKYMENEIDKLDYDIALIGCGAYGLCLAAHCKRMGKQAVHLAGWTQMLFGIYGNRWIKDQPEYSKYINDYWIRPSLSEKPRGAEKIENACYW